MGDARDIGATLERLAELEERLEPVRIRRRDALGDLAIVVLLAPIGLSIDWRSTGALLFLAGVVLALGAWHLFSHISRLPYRREYESLLQEIETEAS